MANGSIVCVVVVLFYCLLATANNTTRDEITSDPLQQKENTQPSNETGNMLSSISEGNHTTSQQKEKATDKQVISKNGTTSILRPKIMTTSTLPTVLTNSEKLPKTTEKNSQPVLTAQAKTLTSQPTTNSPKNSKKPPTPTLAQTDMLPVTNVPKTTKPETASPQGTLKSTLTPVPEQREPKLDEANPGRQLGNSLQSDTFDRKGSMKKETNLAPAESDFAYDSTSSVNFMAYFVTALVFVILGYLIHHNKKKILGFIVEGRSSKNGKRRPKTDQYRKLSTNVEDVMPNLDSSAAKNYIY